MNGVATFVAIIVTLAAIARLAAADPKRRRAFRLPPVEAPSSRLGGWGLVVAPGALLALFGNAADFVVWCGAATTAGWALVAMPPPLQERLAQAAAARFPAWAAPWLARLEPLRRRCGEILVRLDRGGIRPSVGTGSPPSAVVAGGGERLAALEARLALLEVELAEARAAAARRGGETPSVGEAAWSSDCPGAETVEHVPASGADAGPAARLA